MIKLFISQYKYLSAYQSMSPWSVLLSVQISVGHIMGAVCCCVTLGDADRSSGSVANNSEEKSIA